MSPSSTAPRDIEAFRNEALIARSVVGGVLMGLANLVPGISGGTMVLAVGIYPQFIGGVAEVSTLQFRPKVVLMLGVIGISAVVAIGGGAALIAAALEQHRWAMYCLFIGLTLGGVPLIWRAVRPLDAVATTSAGMAMALMILLAAINPERLGGGGEPGLAAYAMLAVAGSSGGAAMIVPGVSGAYFVLILGQYRVIVEAVAAAADAARNGAWAVVIDSFHVLVPVGVGVALGILGVSNLMRYLLTRHERATLGFLLGLLLGAVFGLWPFTVAVPPEIGDVVRGVELTGAEMVGAVDPRYYQRAFVAPTGAQAGAGLALVLAGFGVSWGIGRVGA